eukprot:1160849-Pelagomonas_calceolata.AAC.9
MHSGFSCSDMALVCKEAAMAPVREFLDTVCPLHRNLTAGPCAGLAQPVPALHEPSDTIQRVHSNGWDVREGAGNEPDTSANAEAGGGSSVPVCSIQLDDAGVQLAAGSKRLQGSDGCESSCQQLRRVCLQDVLAALAKVQPAQEDHRKGSHA